MGWRLEGAGAPRRGACAPGRGGSGERLDWLAQNPRETHRVAPQVGPRCRNLSTPAVAQRRPRHDPPGKDVDRPSRQAWRTRPPQPAPRGSGVEERSITQGPPARRVGSDRDRGGPLWVGGPGRAEADLIRCVLDRGPTKTARSRVAGRDRGNAVRPAGQTQAPPAPSLFDTCQILRQLATALDQVRRAEDTRVVLQDRAFRNGQRATRLSPPVPLSHGRPLLASDAPASQHAAGARFPAHGGVRPTLGGAPGRLGPAVLHAPAQATPVPPPPALGDLRHRDRDALAWHRAVLRSPPHGHAGMRRRADSQESREAPARRRLSRRGGPAAHDAPGVLAEARSSLHSL